MEVVVEVVVEVEVEVEVEVVVEVVFFFHSKPSIDIDHVGVCACFCVVRFDRSPHQGPMSIIDKRGCD